MSPSISVIVPVYNVYEFLPRCLGTLGSQTGIIMELILVNDGSTDDSFSICKEYAQRNSNVILIDKVNGGLSDARNAGTKVATGDFIYYLDSDDWLAPDAIKTLFDYAIENDCEIVQGGFYYAYDDHLLYDNKYEKSFNLNRHEAMLELIKNDYVKNFAWGKLYRADIVKKHKFPKGKYYEDSYWQHLIVHECKRYGIVPTPLYYYRQRDSGISGEFSMKNLDLLRGYDERSKFVQENYPEYSNIMLQSYFHVTRDLCNMAKICGDNLIAASYQAYYNDFIREYESQLHVSYDFKLIKRIYARLFGCRYKYIKI